MTDAGIIAAGRGERMKDASPGVPKPLIEVAGRPLVGWVVRGLQRAGAKRITILHNSAGGAVRTYLKRDFPEIAWSFLRADTETSWQTFRIVAGAVAQRAESFLISTVDALVAPDDTARFSREALAQWPDGARPDAAMALTRHVDDEKPLWADANDAGRLTALGETAARRETVTCGLYGLTRAAAEEMPGLPAFPRLRDYWIDLIDRDRALRGVELAKSVDVDRPEDLPAAEDFLTAHAKAFGAGHPQDARNAAS